MLFSFLAFSNSFRVSEFMPNTSISNHLILLYSQSYRGAFATPGNIFAFAKIFK